MTKAENPDVVAATTMGAVASPDTTGDDPMTEKQAAELRQLCEAKNEEFDTSLTASQADTRIEALKD